MIKRIIITGATGLIGRKLSRELVNRGDEVIVFSRDIDKAKDIVPGASDYVKWDYKRPELWSDKINGSDAVIHLAGINIFSERWAALFKKKILVSREISTRNLVNAIEACSIKPKTFICASGVGYYGNGGETILTEDSPVGEDFLADVCKVWEEEAAKVETSGVRRVSVRTGIVLSKEDGALKQMLLPFKLFVGGALGNGKQWFPWLHIDDIVGIYLHAIDDEKLSGALNAASPNIVKMKEFANQLGNVMVRPSLFSVPRFALRLAIGDAADVVLSGQRVDVNKLLNSGYKFKYANLKEALTNLLK